jgi:hypothetical protein
MGNSGHYYAAPSGPRRSPAWCVKCRRPITWGERCEDCKRELRQRRMRKPR